MRPLRATCVLLSCFVVSLASAGEPAAPTDEDAKHASEQTDAPAHAGPETADADGSEAPRPAAERHGRILVLDLRTQGVDAEVAQILSEEVVTALRDAGLGQVLTASDVREMLSLEAQRQLVGCDEGGCLADVAGSLGAREVVTGLAARFDGAVMVRLRLLDTQEATLVRDATAESKSVDELRELVRRAAFDMIDSPYRPRRRREVAWPVDVLEAGGGLLGPSAADTGWTVDLAYTHRAGNVALGPAVSLARSATRLEWADFGPPAHEEISLEALRVGLAARWPATGGSVLRFYGAGELGLLRLVARSARSDAPGWAVTPEQALLGVYASAAVGLRLMPRSSFGFAVEAGLLVTGADPAIKDRDLPVAGETPPEVDTDEGRGAIAGPFLKGVFRYGF